MMKRFPRHAALRALCGLTALALLIALLAAPIGRAAPDEPAAPAQSSTIFASRIAVLPLVSVPSPQPSAARLGVSLYANPSRSVSPGSSLTLEIVATNSGSAGTGGFQVYLPYDRSQLQLSGSSTSTDRGDWVSSVTNNWVTVTFGNLGPGETRQAWLYTVVSAGAAGTTVSIRAEYNCPSNDCRTNRVEVEVDTDEWHPGGQITLAVIPDRGPPGTCHTFSTDQYKPRELVTTWLNTPSGVEALSLTQNADGSGSVSFQLCTGGRAPGAYSFVGYGSESLITGVGAFIVGDAVMALAREAAGTAPATASKRLDLPLDRLGGISGQVADQQGNPLEGVRVLVRDLSGAVVTYDTTGADGRYGIYYGLASGEYRVEFRPGQALSATTAELAFATVGPVTVTEPNVTADVDAVLAPGGAISGLVTTADASAPLPGVPVVVFDENGDPVAATASAANGTYTVRGLPTGNYRVEFETSAARSRAVHAYGGLLYRSGALVGVTAPATTGDVNEALARRPDAGQIVGRVTAGDTGAPLAEVQVSVADGSGVTVALVQTDADGRYSTGDLPAGDYTVALFTGVAVNPATRGYASTGAGPVTVTAGAPATLDVALQPNR